MTKVAIVGAHGQIGQLLIKHLVVQGLGAVGIVRKEEQVPTMKKLGAEPVLLDIENATADQLATCLQGADVDAVVFAAGAGGGSSAERKRTVDYAGSAAASTAPGPSANWPPRR